MFHFVFVCCVVFAATVTAENPCQNLTNCPPCYNNTMDDYVPGTPVTISPELREFMARQLVIYLQKVYKEYPPDKVDAYDVFTGTGGRAYMFLRLFNRTGNTEMLKIAQAYIDTSMSGLKHLPKNYVGFLQSTTGIYTLNAVLASLQGNNDTATEMIAEVQNIFDKATDDNFAKFDDFDSGRAGLIYASTFLKNFYGHDVITRSSIVAIGEAVVRRGQELSSEPDDYLEWLSPYGDGQGFLGTSHGSAGVISQLLDVPELFESGTNTRKMIIKTLDHIVAMQFPSGNFPTQFYPPTEDKLVQWDHGAPGVMATLSKAAREIPERRVVYLNSTYLAADCVWERGLLVKGLMLCHGIVGNTYTQLRVWKMTGDEKYLYRALAFQNFVSQTVDLYGVNEMRYPTPDPYAFYEASFESGIMVWSDLLAVKNNDFSTVVMPGYEAYI